MSVCRVPLSNEAYLASETEKPPLCTYVLVYAQTVYSAEVYTTKQQVVHVHGGVREECTPTYEVKA